MANIEDLINFAVNKSPTEFQRTFNDLVSERIADRLEVAKIEIAQGLNKVDEEQIDELSGAKLGDYAHKATGDFHKKSSEGDYKGAQKRYLGIHKAKKKFSDKMEKKYPQLKKEEAEEQE